MWDLLKVVINTQYTLPRFFFSTSVMDYLGKIRWYHWKERHKIAKFEGATSYKGPKI